MRREQFDIDSFLDSMRLSEDLRKATPQDASKLAMALSLKLCHSNFSTDPIDTAEEMLSSLDERIARRVRELVGEKVSKEDIAKKFESDISFRRFLTCASRSRQSLTELIEYIEDDEPDSSAFDLAGQFVDAIEDFNNVVVENDVLPLIERGIYASDIAQALEVWAKNRMSRKSDERFWQEEFESRKGVLERLLGGHAVLLQSEFHVGGTNASGAGNLRSDFAFLNKINNISLVEIKAPSTNLLGSKYRGTYPLSKDVSGAISQVLIQRSELIKYYFQKRCDSPVPFEVFSPRCFLIVGDLKNLGSDPDKLKAFEVQRQAVASHVSIVTFDELYQQFATFHQL
ncbi:hypothetical protein BKM17_27320 [Pseudomonas syringae group genomosp. 3]|nr:hypothetical protein BKM17_27320 [Pseudomonas syringae group genomosp. 3]